VDVGRLWIAATAHGVSLLRGVVGCGDEATADGAELLGADVGRSCIEATAHGVSLLRGVVGCGNEANAVYRRISRPKNHEITELQAGDGF
jgi:PII-like signaling protein